MQLRLSKQEVLDIVKTHLISVGFKVKDAQLDTYSTTEYEYDGVGIHEKRTPIKVTKLNGVLVDVEN